MNLEQQVCGLELSKKLKELGVKQESLFRWCLRVPSGTTPDEQRKDGINYLIANDERIAASKMYLPEYAAFTAAELGEMLPTVIEQGVGGTDGLLRCSKLLQGAWSVVYEETNGDEYVPAVEADNEADARAKMLIYLIENKLIAV